MIFTLTLVVLTCLTISIWSVDGTLLVHASLGRYAAIGAAGMWGLTMMAWGRAEHLQGLDIGWLTIVFLISVSWVYSIDPSASIGRGIPLVAWSFCLYAMTRMMLGVDGGPLAVLDALLAGVGLFLVAGAVLAFTDPEMVFAGGRYTSSFRSASAVGEVCCIVLPLVIWAALHHPRRIARVPYCCLALIMSGSLLASQVRNAIGALIAGLVATFLFRRRRNLAAEAPLLVAILAVCIAIACSYYGPFAQTDFFQSYISRHGTLETATGRFILWKESLRRVQDHPVMGFGYGTESLAI
ncbi:MAG: O-antigen ligase family protein, partial [Candidatus Dormibacteraceae bacterium]